MAHKLHAEFLDALEDLARARTVFDRLDEDGLILGSDNHIGDIGEYWVRRYYELSYAVGLTTDRCCCERAIRFEQHERRAWTESRELRRFIAGYLALFRMPLDRYPNSIS